VPAPPPLALLWEEVAGRAAAAPTREQPPRTSRLQLPPGVPSPAASSSLFASLFPQPHLCKAPKFIRAEFPMNPELSGMKIRGEKQGSTINVPDV
jgi:hypothetical protein